MLGTERDRLLRLAAELDIELGCVNDAGEAAWAEAVGLAPRRAATFEQMHILSKEDEQVVVALREALGRVVSGVWSLKGPGNGEVEELIPSAIVGGLDGAEFVMRGEILTGGIERLWDLMPSFVYLVTVPIVGQDEALRYATRTSELLAAERDGGSQEPGGER